jgi:hypothetical protein
MLITRISGCKGTTFLLFYKELRNLFIDFAQPFLQFACPLPFVEEAVVVSPSVSSHRIDVEAGRNLVLDEGCVIVHAVGHRHYCVIAAVQDEGRLKLNSTLGKKTNSQVWLL